ncbi:hypothetical protein LINPERHAP1_LOCUS24179 [Linum perenne]
MRRSRLATTFTFFANFLLILDLVTSTSRLLSHDEFLGKIENIHIPYYQKMAEFTVNEYNKSIPDSKHVKLDTVDKGYTYPEGDFQIFHLFITASNQLGKAKYLATVQVGYNNDDFFLMTFTRA